MNRFRPAASVLALLALSSVAFAQFGDTMPENPFAKRYLIYVVAAFLAIFLLLIITIMMRKVRGVRKADVVFGMSIDDVGNLKSKGLLTEEESKAVRHALARQLSKQYNLTGTAPKPGDLLADPEVLRLQAEAEERRKAAARAQVAGISSQETKTPVPTAPASATAAVASDDEDVQLPPDVLTMAELGLITKEELENIKARARQKRQELRNK
jgi:hypothetical protein